MLLCCHVRVSQPHVPRPPTSHVILVHLQRNLLYPLDCFERGWQTVTLKQRNAQGSQVMVVSFHSCSQFVPISSSTFAGLWVSPGPAWQDVLLSQRVFSAEYSQTLAKVSGNVGAPGVPMAGQAVLGMWLCHVVPCRTAPRSRAQLSSSPQMLVLN